MPNYKIYPIFLLFLFFFYETASAVSPMAPITKSQPNPLKTDVLYGGKPSDIQSTVAIIVNLNGTNTICSGVIVSRTQIMTVGHCMYKTSKAHVVFGPTVTQSDGARFLQATADSTNVNLKSVKYAPGYEGKPNSQNDLAIIELKNPIPNQYPTAIIDPKVTARNGSEITLAGYGKTTLTQGQGIRRENKDKLTVNSNDGNGFQMISSQSGVCPLDSGGPAYMTQNNSIYLVGIIQAGDCATNSYATSVTTKDHYDWLSKVIIKDGAAPQAQGQTQKSST